MKRRKRVRCDCGLSVPRGKRRRRCSCGSYRCNACTEKHRACASLRRTEAREVSTQGPAPCPNCQGYKLDLAERIRREAAMGRALTELVGLLGVSRSNWPC